MSKLDFWHDGSKIAWKMPKGSQIDVAIGSSEYYQVFGLLHLQQWIDNCDRVGWEGRFEKINKKCSIRWHTIWRIIVMELCTSDFKCFSTYAWQKNHA